MGWDVVMTLDLQGLRTVIYPAPDLAASRAWWSTALGVQPYFDEPFYVGFDVGGYELGLLPTASPAEGALTFWGVPDVEVAVREAVAAGAREHSPPTDVGDGIITATVLTPMGDVVGLIRNPHFTVGVVADG